MMLAALVALHLGSTAHDYCRKYGETRVTDAEITWRWNVATKGVLVGKTYYGIICCPHTDTLLLGPDMPTVAANAIIKEYYYMMGKHPDGITCVQAVS